MSSRKSSLSEEGLASSKYGERTPLRRLDNEIPHLSNSTLRFKTKSQLSAHPEKMTWGDIPLADPEYHLYATPSTKMIQANPPTTDVTATQTAFGLGDVTFKSIICAGGEVEIANSLLCAEESIILPKDQVTYNYETEDTVISHNMIVQSCCEHTEHPYYNPEMKEPYSADISQPSLCEVPNTTLALRDLDDKQATQDSPAFPNDNTGDINVTWKSFICEGGEIEVSDATRIQDDTIPFPKAELGKPLQDDTVHSTTFSDDSGQFYQIEYADHPYGGHKNDIVSVITSFSETPYGSEKPAEGLSDVTFKSLHCTGGEIEISEGTKFADESVPLSGFLNVTHCKSFDYGIDPSMIAGDDLQYDNDHLDHPYCNHHYSSPHYSSSLVVPDNQAGKHKTATFSSFITSRDEAEKSDGVQMPEKTTTLPEDQVVICQPVDADSGSTSVEQDHIQDDYEQRNSHLENGEAVVDTDPPAINGSSLTDTSLKALDNETVKLQVQAMAKYTVHPEDSVVPPVVHRTEISDCNNFASSAESPAPVEVVEVNFDKGSPESSEGKDSAIGSSGNGPVPCLSAENLPNVLKVLSEWPSVASALQLGLLSPVARRASLSLLKAHGNPAQDPFLTDDSAIEGEKSLLAPFNADPAGLWAEHLESPMPCPLFNSTAVGCKPRPGPELVEDLGEKLSVVPPSEVKQPVMDVPLIPDGPLQQQLRQMAEFLILASGKMGPTVVSASSHPAAVRAAPAESHCVSVGTSPVKLVDHSLNTSGQFERKREFSVVDSCTMTDPLLWNLLPGSLESLPRQELEQRLMSSMIMVEALVQQLAAARVQGCSSGGPPPSDLREKLVQTEHTELSQTTMYRDLYIEALSRIGELELNETSLQNLMHSIQDMRVTMTSLSGDTDATLSNMKGIGDIIREDHQNLISHYERMKFLFEKSKETQMKMMQKVKEALHQRNDMKTKMEEAFIAKEAAFGAMEHLRTHCATEISALEKSVGSQQELLVALNQTYPEQVALNKTYTETLNSASGLLSQTMDEQSSLMKDLFTVRSLLQKSTPILLKLNETAAAALRERDEHKSARDQATEEREQIEGQLNEAYLNLQSARAQIGDLNLQVTILTSEMGVLRQKLTEKEEEAGQLERKVTELSATVSSTLASYTFLEQALAAETTKLQQSWKDIKQTKERANKLETSLDQSEQHVCELSHALAQREEQLSQLQIHSQSQNAQIQQLQDVCTQLSGVQEMNEFLLMENELAREQVAESERLLRENLLGLRERNIQCEDLKGEVCQLQLENKSLQEELAITRSRASTTQLELEEKMAQAATEITLLLHTLRGLTNELHAAFSDQKPELQKDKDCQPVINVEHHSSSSSFVDSIMLALTTEREEDVKTDKTAGSVPSDIPEPQCETLFSETSAFTRIAAFSPKKNLTAVGFEPEEEEQSSMAELLSDLGSTVTELISTLKVVQQRKDSELEELHHTICGLQVEQDTANNRHEAEVLELKHQLSRLNNLVERGSQALQQKAQDEKTLTSLAVEVKEAQETLNKHKTDNNELRKDVIELRRTLQQSKVESQFLREELRKAGDQSATPAQFMEEKIQLLKEVERLKASLQEVEQARVRLLERAKRHQIIHQTNQQKSENELHILNSMINKIRETLRCLPKDVKNCEQIHQLLEYIG